MRPLHSRLWLIPLALTAGLIAGGARDASAQDGGATVVLLQNRPVFFFSTDPGKNLMSLHFPSDVFLCGGSSPLNRGDILLVTTPSEVQSFLALIKDEDGQVMIFNTSDLTEAFGPGGFGSDIPLFCSFINGPKKIAEGTVRRTSAFSGESFSASWSGSLRATDGTFPSYSEQVVFTVDPQTGERTIRREGINLH